MAALKHVGASGWLTACLLSMMSVAAAQPLQGMALIDALRNGGYSIYFRHQATDWSQDDYVRNEGDWTSCDGGQIRQLSDAGRAASRQTGAAMRELGIPVLRRTLHCASWRRLRALRWTSTRSSGR